MTSSKRYWVAAALIVLVVAAAFLVVRHEEGFFSPAISADGQFVYFMKRSTVGAVWGLGFEFFTPPAHAFLWHDQFALCRIRMDGGGFEILGRPLPSPLQGRIIDEYRGRVFTVPRVVLRMDGSQLQYQVAISVPRQPSSEMMVKSGEWPLEGGTPPGARVWSTGDVSLSSGEDMLREPWEVLPVPGREGYPCAVVAYNDRTAELRVLRRTLACRRLYTGGIRWENVAEQSRREQIRRLRNLRELREQLIAQARSAGRNEGSAILGADRQLAQMGYYPTPPQLVAQPVAPEAARRAQPLFLITEMEFKVGLFEDLAQAIASPGNEVEKSTGQYIVHRDYDTSRRLNEFLQAGGKTFYVQRSGRVFRITLQDGRPAYR